MPTAEEREVQLAVIQSEIEAAPLLSHPVEPLTEDCRLVREFADNPSLFPKVLSLVNSSSSSYYHGIRYARRDGNCFYRCAAFALLEDILNSSIKTAGLRERLLQLRPLLLENFGSFVEDFCDAAASVVAAIAAGAITTSKELHASFTGSDSEYVLYFFRYAVSYYIRAHPDEFLPFVMGLNYENVEEFCRAEVDAVGSESDHVQVVAFAKCFNCNVVVEYLDGSEGSTTTRHTFNGSKEKENKINEESSGTQTTTIIVLYRPGHYDLLYK